MDFSNLSHEDDQSVPTEQKESHWQPSLRPNDDEALDESGTPVTASKTASASIMDQPSVRPALTSNLSFSHDDDEEQDEETNASRLDPAWGIRRTDSAHILDTVHRSPSFPAPEQHHFPASPSSQPTAQVISQTKPIVEEEEQDLWNTDRENIFSTDITNPEHTEPGDLQERSRFDEGLPLISSEHEGYEHHHEHPLVEHEQQTQPSAFDSINQTERDGFFDQLEENPTFEATHRPSIERKETEEVLNGLGVQDALSDSPPPSATEPPKTSTLPVQKEKDLAAAFADTGDDESDLAAAFAMTTINEEDPWKAAMGDDEDFLIEDADDLLPDSDEEVEMPPLQSRAPAVSSSSQRAASFARTNSNPYAPHQPSTAELTQFGSTSQNVGLSRQPSNPMNAFQPPQQQSNITNRAESFADQAKGGYKSPYDLPMDLAPKKRVNAQRVVPPSTAVPPPPRSSSINSERQLQSPFSPEAPTFSQLASPPAPAAAQPVNRAASVPVKSPPQSNKRASAGFFEELPIAPRARPSPAPARAPVAQLPPGPPRQTSVSSTSFQASPPQIQHQSPSQPLDSYAQYQLQAPERLDPYSSVPLQPTQAPLAPAPPAPSSRYSPAPPAVQNGIKPSPSPRYSPAPPPQVAGPRYSPAPPAQTAAGHNRYVSQPLPTNTLPHQPRTSSPLAQNRRSVDESADQAQPTRPLPHHATSSSVPYAASFSAAAAATLSPPRVGDPSKQEIVPPRRSQTQSPSRQMARPGAPPRIAPPPNRPASAFGQLSPTREQPPQTILSPPRVVAPQRETEKIDYIRPNDETANDPLERWKGAPIFTFGFGGTVITSFPRKTPRYSAGATRPQFKVTAGEVNIRKLDTVIGASMDATKFPGPLKGKAKKKEVLIWLTSTISNFENTLMSTPSRRLEEKILLWKVVKILVEQDGSLESPSAVQSMSAVLMPEVYSLEDTATSSQQINDVVPGLYRPATFTAKSETVDPVAVEKLRKTLLRGKREDGVWQAVDNRLWSHALLLASTLDKSIWKQVVAEFVKQEVKTIGSSLDSLSALYEILGGNMEESIDQLVPPSARAGLQMVSKVDSTGPTRNALDGLDKWKETLCLILNNRSFEDQRALITLARLLSDYGRVEAAHMCYLVARSIALPNVFGGADDPASLIVLLGADHRYQPFTFHHDTDAIHLTEVYEFAVSTLSTGATGTPMPHLVAYKLQLAYDLTDAGMKTEAQAYCDTIAGGLKSNTKQSLYFNAILLGEVEDLSNRLKQIPVEKASWIAKPSIEKVSGSLFSKFSNFVTGEDSDAESKGSGRDAAEAGPFANVSGSPNLSRNASQTDLYGSYPANVQMTPVVAPTSAGSRYAPNGMSSARSSTELTRGRASMDYTRSPPSTSHSNHSTEQRSLYAPAMQAQQSPYSPLAMSPPVSGYQPSPIYQPGPELHMPSVAEEPMPPQRSRPQSPEMVHEETNGHVDDQPAFGGYIPTNALPPTQDNFSGGLLSNPEQAQSSFEPSSNDTGYGYQPPEDGGYVPYQPDPESDDEKPKPKKKSFGEDDDFSSTSQSTYVNPSVSSHTTVGDEAAEQARKKANDEAADAAFRAAAEADAQQAKEQASRKKASGSWLGGWFGGAKKPDSLDAAPSKSGSDSKVHRVHLGESKMKLYYDKEKKKWINPDNPEASEKKALAPPPRSSSGSVPPPMSGPPRSVSTPHSLPAGGISRSGTPASQAVDTGSEGGDSRPGTGHGQSGFAATLPPGTQQSLGLAPGSALPTPPGSSGSLGPSGAGPPSRPSSALSNASGLDDLLGPPGGARKVSGRAAKGKKGRYVDVMAQ